MRWSVHLFHAFGLNLLRAYSQRNFLLEKIFTSKMRIEIDAGIIDRYSYFLRFERNESFSRTAKTRR